MAAVDGTARRWSAHPWRARGLRFLVYLLPIVGSLLFVRVATELTGVPTSSLWLFLAWWLGISVSATVVVSVLYACTRRLLPLGALLNLSLVFPDEAPSRFMLALGTGTVETLEQRLSLMRKANEAPNAQRAAEILLQLVAALDVHDKITRGHAERVRAYSYSLGTQLRLSREDLDRLNWAALLHDIGKLEVSSETLNNPGKPTDEQWEELKLHPLHGEMLVAPMREWLGEWSDAVGYHHERWDGKGYPRGIAGEQIPLPGRIVAIADVFDVITSMRSYKEPATPEEARAELTRCSGTQFDPALVRAFVNISLGRMRLVMGPISWLSHAPLLARFPLTPSVTAALGGLASLATAATTGIVAPHANAETTPVREAAAAHTPATNDRAPTGPRPRLRVRVVRPHPAPVKAVAPLPAPVASTAAPSVTKRVPISQPLPPPAPKPPAHSAPAAPSPPPPPAPTPELPAAPSPQPQVPPPPPAAGPPPPLPPPPPPPPPPPSAPVNVAPSFTPGPNQTVYEDTGPQSFGGWATSVSPGPPSESAQTVTFSVSSDNPTLFSAQPAVASNGTLTFTPAANANGLANVTVTAHDDGGTAGGGVDTSTPSTFTLTVDSLNDPPTFTAGPNQSAVSLLGAQTVPGWATGIAPGPANESGQTVSFTVTNDNPGLFSVQPAVAPNGTLTYTPAALALGSATVTVKAVDDGGKSGPGADDTSPTQTFTITIL